MKREGNERHSGLGLARIVALVVAALLVSSGIALAQQARDIYASADLRPEGASEGPPPSGSANGTAVFERLASGDRRVTLTVAGLPPNTKHVNHVHEGSCTG